MPNILIVDREPCVRSLLLGELRREGYAVEGVGDAKSARLHLRSSQPDLVLIDLYFDGGDGREVLRDVKRQDPYLPVLIVSAHDSLEDDPRLRQADGHVVKSLNFMQLKQKIARLLDKKICPQAAAEIGSRLRTVNEAGIC